MNSFIIGGDSTIGSALANALASRGDTVYATTRRAIPASENAMHLDLASSDIRCRSVAQGRHRFLLRSHHRFCCMPYKRSVGAPSQCHRHRPCLLADWWRQGQELSYCQPVQSSTGVPLMCRQAARHVLSRVYGKLKAEAESGIFRFRRRCLNTPADKSADARRRPFQQLDR